MSVVLPRLQDYNHGMPGTLPLQIQQVSEVLAAALGLPEPGGAAVAALNDQADSLKDKIRPGDTIKTINGLPVLDPRDLARRTARASVGSMVTLGFYRGTETVLAEVPIVPLIDSLPIVGQMPPPTTLGLHLTTQKGDRIESSVVIDTIDEAGSVADSGLQKGDVVLQVDQEAVNTVDQAMAALQARIEAKRSYAAVLFQRDKARQWTALSLPE